MKVFLRVVHACALCIWTMGTAHGGSPFETGQPPRPNGVIDEAVFSRLKTLGIKPANQCSDAVFVRRVYLDVIGTLPMGYEAKEFLLDKNPNKRRLLIDKLLEREEFADYWAMKWSDLLRVKAEFPINLWPNAAQAYHRWIRDSIKENKPYDQFARELLTASGSNFREAPVNFYRALQSREPESIARTVALTFMGTRAEKWPKDRLPNLALFFSQVGYKRTAEWKEEIVFFDQEKLSADAPHQATLPDGTVVWLSSEKDPRLEFADWLIDPDNPWFTRNIANRVWSWFFGRGIIHEPDDIRPDNPPSNPELLTALERQLVSSGYDLKQLMRLILNSATYQLSSISASSDPRAEANFAYYPIRRLDAEVLIDAINQITGSTEEYSSAIPEPFTFIPEEQRSIALPDGSISSSFLELFGKPPRDTGLESERNNNLTSAQRLHLLNSSHIARKIDRSRMVQYQTQGNKSLRQIVSALYLGILSRYPTGAEIAAAEEYQRNLKGKQSKRQATVDLTWALINSTEFLYRH